MPQGDHQQLMVYYGYFYSTKAKLIAVRQIVCPINPNVFTIWPFSVKKKKVFQRHGSF